NYMINIGGEIVVKGMSPKNKEWKIGVNKPVEDSLSQNDEILTVLNLSNTAMATSGNYRNFYYRNGKKYAHTIDPRIGYPVQHSLLSATVIAKKCALADAYATSFMVMGLEEAKAFCQKHPEIEAYFIYSGEDGSYRTYFTPSLKKKIAD
ncbi:MAG: FAD:protein FMN transferase, partial [Bacteroidaceae bacterium]|nr:FAD:protein FMN transferase [Bacteroidaceae bacterium]